MKKKFEKLQQELIPMLPVYFIKKVNYRPDLSERSKQVTLYRECKSDKIESLKIGNKYFPYLSLYIRH